MSSTIGLTETERMELSHRATSRSGRADDGRRARLILLLEAGHTWAQIRHKLDCNDAFIARWSKRFGRERLAGLFSRHAGHGSEQADAGLGGADPGLDAEAKAGRRVDALEHAQAGFGAVDLAHDGGAGMDKPRPEAPAARPLHGFE